MIKVIAFWLNEICERGVTTAVYDYAYYNETVLKNRSIVFYDKNHPDNVKEVIDRFTKKLLVIGVDSFSEVDDYIMQYKCDLLYVLKYGVNDNKISKFVKTAVHCVFNCSYPHGNVYAAISPSLHGYNPNIPIVPHIVSLPDTNKDLRKELGIPRDVKVFGRYGGKDSFDNLHVHTIVYEIAKNRPDFCFLFANTDRFCPVVPNIIHVNKIIDPTLKVAFINTCDAMLWARMHGETFGLSIAEFSIKNKPVICKITNNEDEHIRLLGDKCILYTEETLADVLSSFDKQAAKEKDWNAYRDFTPEKVMALFNKYIIEPCVP